MRNCRARVLPCFVCGVDVDLGIFWNLIVIIPFGTAGAHLLALPTSAGEVHGALQVV